MAFGGDHVRAAVAAARAAGHAVERGEVITVAANVLVRLEPGPVAARLAGAKFAFRDTAASLAREVRLVSALAAAGARVVAPLGGPYAVDGTVVTLWPWVEGASGDAAAAGSALRACHDALRARWAGGGGRSGAVATRPLTGRPRSARDAARPASGDVPTQRSLVP